LDEPFPPLIRAENIHRYLGSGEAQTHILKGVNAEIRRGEYVSIVGQSGSGKSTLLYLLGGLDRPSTIDAAGEPITPPSRIFVDGHETTGMDEGELANLRNERIGFVFQFHYLLKEFTAQENVALPMFRLGRLKRAAAMERAADLLNQLGLGEKVKRRTNKLSGGEQQRVAIARALANAPAVLLADEPTGNLDRKNTDLVAGIFADIASKGQAIVMVSHDTQLAQRASRMISMEDGHIVGDRALRASVVS
jgi:lipoprotein-releasing system ATP-binding protein